MTALASEDAGPAPPVPDDVKLEVKIALGRAARSDELTRLAIPAPLTCPDCGGVLSQVKRRPPLRFRCQVGHAFNADALEVETRDAVAEAMRMAFRIVEERATLLDRMAADARQNGRKAAAAISEKNARECRHRAEVLQRAILEGHA